MFRRLEYQERVLDTLAAYLDRLKGEKARADEAAEVARQHPGVKIQISDFARETWEVMCKEGRLPRQRAHVPFSPRRDGCDRPVPNVVLKVPTGGGKTWLAVNALSSILGRYVGKSSGFVLWIVPNEAIYSQTLKNLRDQAHQYRQALDRESGNRTLILEKNARLDARQVEGNLCVMLLMLQSANRETQSSLKMFQDRGDVHGFFPREGDQQGHGRLLERVGNLEGYHGMFAMVKASLGNALRIIRPIVVLDEGHRAVSELAYKTLYGFNPCFVLELTATPRDVQATGGRNPKQGRNANVLVEVTGRQLDQEGMIKMPLNLDSRQGEDWKTTLNAAVEKLGEVERAAQELYANSERYIRPIMLIQVERTGGEQRGRGAIHAEDVRECLVTWGFDEAEIAIKTAERNDLNQPENQDLLSPLNRVRAIITKQALQEGWDCPFAYILCCLSESHSLGAMTQLTGRILRQPHAAKTNIAALDECHVITHYAGTGAVVGAIKKGLEQGGLGDLSVQVSQGDGNDGEGVSRMERIERREEFKDRRIYLPKVMFVNGEVREVDYETDILARIDWREYDPAAVADRIPKNARVAEQQLQRIWLGSEGEDGIRAEEIGGGSGGDVEFDTARATRRIFDLTGNGFAGREIVGALLVRLQERGFDAALLGRLAALVVEELRRDMSAWRDERAERLFKEEVRGERIQFRLRLDARQNWLMPEQTETMVSAKPRLLVGTDGAPVQKSLFAPLHEGDFNEAEKEVAGWLDGEATLNWWHRNVVRAQYGIQGWRRGRIYPDFLFSVDREGRIERLMILETKGEHLSGNQDTEYKRELLDFLSREFRWNEQKPVGELELVQNNGEEVRARLVLMDSWKRELPAWVGES